jgi:hypothetical protein
MTPFGLYLRVKVMKTVFGRHKEVNVMQAAQLTIPNSHMSSSSSLQGKISNLVARVFGCWHAQLSRPFSHQGRAYRSCLNCGAQRQFNLGNWQMQGKFYYGKPQITQIQSV